MIVPIGSWCRPAFQTSQFIKESGSETISYPFDWTITPFSSLKIILNNDFDENNILQPRDIEFNKVGSVTDGKTGIVHHHDFLPRQIKEVTKESKLNQCSPLDALLKTNLIEKAKGRFSYTYKNLKQLKHVKSKIGFIRWQSSHKKFPNILEGEDVSSLSEVIKGFLQHENFAILLVKSKAVDGELPQNPIVSYTEAAMGAEAIILERKGYDGDKTNSFRGDTKSWSTLLTKFTNIEEISPENPKDKESQEYES